jgi:hypothetical protein
MKTVAPTVIDVCAVAPATVVGKEDVSHTNKNLPEEVAGDRIVMK